MKKRDFTVTISIEATPQEVFKSINNVSKWWTENMEGSSQKLNDEFEVRFGEVHYSKQKLTEVIPNKKVVWLVTDSKLNFLEDKQEWTGTQVIFEIISAGDETQVRFTHMGLHPSIECFGACSNAWSDYINNSLRSLINTGQGIPTLKAQNI